MSYEVSIRRITEENCEEPEVEADHIDDCKHPKGRVPLYNDPDPDRKVRERRRRRVESFFLLMHHLLVGTHRYHLCLILTLEQ